MKTLKSMLLLPLLLFMSCGEQKKEEQPELTPENSIKVTHQQGEATVPLNPERVVLFSYGALDSMHELGLTDKIVGMPTDNVPPYLRDIDNISDFQNVGSLMEPNYQRINELEPDLIIIGLRQVSQYEELSEIAPTIIYELDYTDYLGSVENNLEILGSLYDKDQLVAEKMQSLQDDISRAQEKIADQDGKGLIVLYNEGKFSAYGKASRFGFIHDVLGVTPVAEDLEVATHGRSISSEFIEQNNPDYLFVIDRGAAIQTSELNKNQIENALVQQTSAYENDNIIYLSPGVWYLAGGGLRALEIMTEEVAAAF